MACKVRLTSAAENDLGTIVSYLVIQAPHVAEIFLDELDQSIALLGRYPKIGRPFPRDVRQLLVMRFDYLIYYRIESDELVLIHAILHGRRDPAYLDERIKGELNERPDT